MIYKETQPIFLTGFAVTFWWSIGIRGKKTFIGLTIEELKPEGELDFWEYRRFMERLPGDKPPCYGCAGAYEYCRDTGNHCVAFNQWSRKRDDIYSMNRLMKGVLK